MTHSEDEIRVSDHAVLRYLERAYDLNVDDVKRLIIKQTKRRMKNKSYKDGIYPFGQHVAQLRDNCITTIMHRNEKRCRLNKKHVRNRL